MRGEMRDALSGASIEDTLRKRGTDERSPFCAWKEAAGQKINFIPSCRMRGL